MRYNYARRVKGCARGKGERNNRRARGRVNECDRREKQLTVTDITRHQKERVAQEHGRESCP